MIRLGDEVRAALADGARRRRRSRRRWSPTASRPARRRGGGSPREQAVRDERRGPGDGRACSTARSSSGLDRIRARALRRPRAQDRDRATWPRPPSRARPGRRPSAGRSPPAAPPGSSSWRPAASAVCTAAGRRRPTSRPTSARSRGRRVLVVSSRREVAARRRRDGGAARDARRCRWSARRSDEMPRFYIARGGPPVSARVDDAASAAELAARPLGARRRRASCSARPPRGEPGRSRGADRAGARRGRGGRACTAVR